ncbi:MAG: aminotransferase class V-fold PLP-dependent enzyme [Gemmatimonadota bacterium]|nr:MAG: aminotransferase class V-fold PLP-dependent enzyme [Gemmatimonadota bacterium]
MSSSFDPGQFAALRKGVVGIDREVPLLDGTMVPYVNLDNAATTPPLREVVETVERFLPHYSSVHRGSGFKSRLSTVVYDQAHDIIGRFVRADLDTNTVIFGKNTTEAINKLSYRLNLSPDAVVLTTQLEHHSNDLPWRDRANVVHVKSTPDGRLDEADFDRLLARYSPHVALVTVTAASNVSGFVQPIHRLARKAHQAGARILVDAAQLVAHRELDMRSDDDPEHLDSVAMSGHKMYAPFGTGALVGPQEVFLSSGPEYSGGGTVDVVTLDEVQWTGLPDREEPGSPNIIGAIAMAAAAKSLMDLGMENVRTHEDELIAHTLLRFQSIPGIQVYGESNPNRSGEKVGVVPFNVAGLSHFLVAAILGYEHGIGVRNGRFCAHPYVVHLLDLPKWEQEAWQRHAVDGDETSLPGMVRASLGCYNNEDDIDRLAEALQMIARGEYSGDYVAHQPGGDLIPTAYEEPFADFFLLEPYEPALEVGHGACGN